MPGYRQEVFNVLLAQLLQMRGVISAHGDARAALLIAQIDLDRVNEVRARVPVFRDRRAEVYKKWQRENGG